jgi:Cu/Ag efflux protein CusF
MKMKRFLFGMLYIGLAGCTPYQLQPLSLNHPANAQAMATPALSRSKTLAYSREDVPAAIAASVAQPGHEGHHPGNESNGQKSVTGEGKVIATVPNASQVVVEHGEIKGFMDAMTMGYRVEPSSLLESLKAGDQVRFTIDVPKKTIVKIEKMK